MANRALYEQVRRLGGYQYPVGSIPTTLATGAPTSARSGPSWPRPSAVTIPAASSLPGKGSSLHDNSVRLPARCGRRMSVDLRATAREPFGILRLIFGPNGCAVCRRLAEVLL